MQDEFNQSRDDAAEQAAAPSSQDQASPWSSQETQPIDNAWAPPTGEPVRPWQAPPTAAPQSQAPFAPTDSTFGTPAPTDSTFGTPGPTDSTAADQASSHARPAAADGWSAQSGSTSVYPRSSLYANADAYSANQPTSASQQAGQYGQPGQTGNAYQPGQTAAGQYGQGASAYQTGQTGQTGQYGQPGGSYPSGQPGAASAYPYAQQPAADYSQSAYPGYQTGYGAYYAQGQSYPYASAYSQSGQQAWPSYEQASAAYQPTATATAVKPKKRRWGAQLLVIVLAFALGMGTFAGAEQAFQTLFPQETTRAVQPNDPTAEDPQGSGNEYPWGQGGSGSGGQYDPSGQDQQGGQSNTGSSQVEAAQSAGVVFIEGATTSGTAYGTGMVLSSDGKVLTNYHVVAGTTKLSVEVVDTAKDYDAKVLGFDQERDVALLQLDGASGLTTVKTDDDKLSTGDAIAAVGNAQGNGTLVRADGKVTGLDKDLTVSSDSPWQNFEDLSGLIETDANAVPGDSGGPMFDSENEVTGMTTAGSESDSVSYAIPISEALSIVQVIEAGQDSGSVRVGPAAYLGISVSDRVKHQSTGQMVTYVDPDSPAAQIGMEVSSTLTKIGDTQITSDTNLAMVIRELEPGARVDVTWYTPQGEQKTATATLGESATN
ncbi:MAG: trypsin-like peptidase domain-containing protein [Propionibacteriaceae bacterium]|jgi:S1-C subfamily serine protease|nr:trypsin-like peptidase domain-containing protein [Propionibacteriaceae bacterium]